MLVHPVPAAARHTVRAVPCSWLCPLVDGGKLTGLPSPRLPEEARQRRVFEMVEALQEHPRDPHQILIGYSRGLVVIWDLRGSRVLCHFLSSQVGGAWDSGRRHVALPDPAYPMQPMCRGVGVRARGLPP